MPHPLDRWLDAHLDDRCSDYTEVQEDLARARLTAAGVWADEAVHAIDRVALYLEQCGAAAEREEER